MSLNNNEHCNSGSTSGSGESEPIIILTQFAHSGIVHVVNFGAFKTLIKEYMCGLPLP